MHERYDYNIVNKNLNTTVSANSLTIRHKPSFAAEPTFRQFPFYSSCSTTIDVHWH